MEAIKIRIGIPLTCIGTGLALSFVVMDANANVHNNNHNNNHVMNVSDSWTGAYFGTYFGAGAGNTDQSFTENQSTTQTFISPTTTVTFVSHEVGSGKLNGHSTGSVADLFVGYNFYQPCYNFVYGAQLEGTIFSDITLKSIGTVNSTQNTTQTVVNAAGTTVTSSTGTETDTEESLDDLRSMFKFVARAGYLIKPNVLGYLLAGAVEGHFVVPDSDDPFGGKRGKWRPGYTVGAGLEYQFNEHWSVRGEYRYINIDIHRSQSSSFTEISQQATSSSTFQSSSSRNSKTDFDFNVGEVGVVYRF